MKHEKFINIAILISMLIIVWLSLYHIFNEAKKRKIESQNDKEKIIRLEERLKFLEGK